MAALGGLLVVIGYAIGGIKIASVFLVIALVINFVAYWFSDKIAIASAGAKPVSESEAPRLYQMVRELTTRAGLPMPRLYVIPSDQPNAFATGRNPKHAAVAVTSGITKLLSEDELRGVISHELAHVRQLRHPHDVDRLGDRRHDHLDRLPVPVVRGRRRVAARTGRQPWPSSCWRRSPRA